MPSVLIIEDSRIDAELMLAFLEDEGLGPEYVTTAPTLALALVELGRRDFDAIVLDLRLPDSPGWRHTLREVRAVVGDRRVFVHSGLQDPDVLQEVQAMDYINKAEPESARKVVRQVLRSLSGRTRNRGLKESAEEALRRLKTGPVGDETRQMVAEILKQHRERFHA